MKPTVSDAGCDRVTDNGTDGSGPGDVAGTPGASGSGVLGRWSRRKRAAAIATAVEDPAPGGESEQHEVLALPPENAPTEPLLSDDDMPDLATLDGSSDISPFFNRGVSATLKKAALRHIFSLPKYNLRDGLDDYDSDYSRFEPLGDAVTCDMRFHAARHEKARLFAEVKAQLESDFGTESDSGTGTGMNSGTGQGADQAGMPEEAALAAAPTEQATDAQSNTGDPAMAQTGIAAEGTARGAGDRA